MHLTRDEEKTLNGEHGGANQTCMKILVQLGELFSAEKLIPIASAHISGVSYKTLGDAPIEFLEAFANRGAKVKVRTTVNPQSMDPSYLPKKLHGNLSRQQFRILKQFERIGTTSSLTCTPYEIQKPKQGSHNAWAESSAVIHANSVLHAWTNREGGPSALAAAIIGKTPDYGVHKAENREPNLIVDVKAALKTESDFGALGIFLGKSIRERIPDIQGLKTPSKIELKQLGAALATTGMANMFHCDERPQDRNLERMTIEAKDLKKTTESLCTALGNKPDLIFLGCPHCSLDEMKKIACLMKGKKVRKDTEFWVCTSSHIKQKAISYVKQIEQTGGHVLSGVCTVVSWTEKLGIETIMTSSAKTAYYAPTLSKAKTILAPMEQCIKTVLKGKNTQETDRKISLARAGFRTIKERILR